MQNWIASGLLFLLTACQAQDAPPAPAVPPEKVGALLFDDFSVGRASELAAHGWELRQTPGWPGVPGASWLASAISVEDVAGEPANRMLQLAARTDGTRLGTVQTQVCQARKFFAGTYATRIYLRSQPVSGAAGDGVVQAFYTISPLRFSLDPAYSELDFEYLPRGGWGVKGPALFNTSWETVRLQPWEQRNRSDVQRGELEGWHQFTMQVADGQIRYFLDDAEVAQHDGAVYPRQPMSMNFNLWFIAEDLQTGGAPREYHSQIDWVLHVQGQTLSPQAIKERVAALRAQGRDFVDELPASNPPLPAMCSM